MARKTAKQALKMLTSPPETTSEMPGEPNVVTEPADQLEQFKNQRKQQEFNNRVVEWTKGTYQQCRTIRQQVERQWYLNLAFIAGRQYVQTMPYSVGGGVGAGVRLWVPPAPYYRSRPVINRISPVVRNFIAKLTAQKPSATIVPASNEDRDLYAAQCGEQIWDSVYRDKKLKDKMIQTVFWVAATGNGFMKCYWDPKKTAADGSQGDLCFENVTPFHLFFKDLLCTSIEDQPFVIQVSTKPIEWVRLHYPDLPVQPNAMEASDILNEGFLNIVGAADQRRDAVMCFEVWVKPGNVSFMPNGGMFTVMGDFLVQFEEGFKYGHDQYPFSHVGDILTGRFYFDTVVSQLVPIQREYNRTRGQIMENKNMMGHQKIIAAEGSIDVTKINNEPGQAIMYRLGFPQPVPFPMQGLPPYIVQEVEQLQRDFDDISGQHDVSKGTTPPGVTAATAISFLQEQDDSMMSTAFSSLESAFEKLAYQTLCHVQQYWDLPRTIRVVGRDGQFNAMTFKGSDLRDNTDIRIEAGSALPTSKAAKQALLMDLMTQGFIPPDKGLELMDVGGINRLYDELAIDTAQASRENMKMAAITPDLMEEYLAGFQPPEPAMPPDAGQLFMGGDTANAGINPGTGTDAMGMPGAGDPNSMPPELMQMLGGDAGGQPPVGNDPTADPMAVGGPDPVMQQNAAPFVDPNTGQPLVDQSGMPTEPPLIVPVNSFDNHQIHIQVHNNFRKSQEYENLEQEAKDLFEEHVNQHVMSMGVTPGLADPSGATMDSGQVQQMGGAPPEEQTSPEESGGPPNG